MELQFQITVITHLQLQYYYPPTTAILNHGWSFANIKYKNKEWTKLQEQNK